MFNELVKIAKNVKESRENNDLDYFVYYVIDETYAFVVFANRSTASILNEKKYLKDLISVKKPALLSSYKTSMISFEDFSNNKNNWVSVN